MSLATTTSRVGGALAAAPGDRRSQKISRKRTAQHRRRTLVVAAAADDVVRGGFGDDDGSRGASVKGRGDSSIAAKMTSRRQALGSALVAVVGGAGGIASSLTWASAAFADETAASASASAAAPAMSSKSVSTSTAPAATPENSPKSTPAASKQVPYVRYKGSNWSVVVRTTRDHRPTTTKYPQVNLTKPQPPIDSSPAESNPVEEVLIRDASIIA